MGQQATVAQLPTKAPIYLALIKSMCGTFAIVSAANRDSLQLVQTQEARLCSILIFFH